MYTNVERALFSKHNKGRNNVSYAFVVIIKGKSWEVGICCQAGKRKRGLTISSEVTASVHKHIIAQSYVPTTTSILLH